MKLSVRSIPFDFLFGGAIVVGALLVASLLGPTAGGILAGAPIRASGVIFLEYLHEGVDKATELTRGVVFAMIANVFFAVVLYLSIPKFGLGGAFLAASAVFIAVIAVMKLMGLL
jgi:hypothetical protein